MADDQQRNCEESVPMNDLVEVIEISAVPKEQDPQLQQTKTISNYQPRTLKPNCLTSRRRCALLPAYPTYKHDTRPPFLLLANVANIDRDVLKEFSFPGIGAAALHGNEEYCPFKLQVNLQHEYLDSFLIDFHQKLYIETSKRWKINLALLDYNLTRLQQCMTKYSVQTGEAAVAFSEELPTALEFYLQIDVDLFFMKTCHYRDAQPRLMNKQQCQEKEGILCEKQPSARYGTRICRGTRCILCASEQSKSTTSGIMKFSERQIHHFVNSYQAILNCPASCDTENVIYALTCPCGEYDYVGSTAKSFTDRVHEHREEGHRIIREFLIGPQNMTVIFNQDKRKVEPLANPYDLLLYQHSARCQFGLKRFLQKNPSYWCFIPQLLRHVKLDNDAYMAALRKDPALPTKTHHASKPMLFAEIMADMTRNDDETDQLARHVPVPPAGYGFSFRQREEQTKFFQTKQDNCVYPSDFVDLYNYAIVAVLPSDCSHHLRKFIESLFITHAQTKLNLIGRLTHDDPTALYDNSVRGTWCSNLIHPIFQS